MRKAVIVAAIVVVILIVNFDRIFIIDDYFKASVLFVLAGLLSIYEYKRGEKAG